MQTGRGAGSNEISSDLRACFHDLRNFFAVIGAAHQMLLRKPDSERLSIIAQALELVARDGVALTTRILAQSEAGEDAWCDPGQALRDLQVMLAPLGGPRTLIRVEAEATAALVKLAPMEIQAIALEVVYNALASGAHHLVLRGKTVARRYWLICADDGHGCEIDGASSAFVETGEVGAAHGSGLKRIGQALRRAGGVAMMRSEPRKGCAIGLAFPLTEASEAWSAQGAQLP